MTQDEFARRVGVSPRTISRWEIGTVVPRRLGLAALASLFKAKNGGSKILPLKVSKEFYRLARESNTAVGKAVHRKELPQVCSRYIRRGAEVACVDCGDVAQLYDHRDYFKPLDVEPVCQACNARRGLAIQTFSDHQEFWSKFKWK